MWKRCRWLRCFFALKLLLLFIWLQNVLLVHFFDRIFSRSASEDRRSFPASDSWLLFATFLDIVLANDVKKNRAFLLQVSDARTDRSRRAVKYPN